jgi:hypothetical protein
MSKRRTGRPSASGVRNVYFEKGPHTPPGGVYRVRFRHLGAPRARLLRSPRRRTGGRGGGKGAPTPLNPRAAFRKPKCPARDQGSTGQELGSARGATRQDCLFRSASALLLELLELSKQPNPAGRVKKPLLL